MLLFTLLSPIFAPAQDVNITRKFRAIKVLLNSRPDSAIHLTETILESPAISDSIQAKANFYLGKAYYFKGLYYTSGEHYKDALKTEYASRNGVFRSKCHSNLGMVFDLTDQFDLALKNYIASMEIDEQLEDYTGVNQSKINIGALYNTINQYDKSERFLREAKTYFTRADDIEGQAMALKNLAIVSKNKGKMDWAKQQLEKALSLYERVGNKFEYANVLNQLAIIEIINDRFDTASSIIDNALKIAEKNDYGYLEARCRLTRAKLMIGKGHYYIAYEYLREIKSFNRRIAKEKHMLIIQAASKTHNFKNFKNELSAYDHFRDSLEKKNTNMIVNELHIKYDTKNRIRKIKNQEEQLVKNRHRLIAAAIIIFVLAVLLVIIFSYHRKLQKSYKEIFLKEKQVQSDFARTISAESHQKKPGEASASRENNNGDEKLWESIINLMKDEEYYLNPGLTVNDVARASNSNRSYVSKTIKNYSNQNFCTFVNRFRIEKAKKILQDHPDYAQESVAELSGFKSTATFYRIFKNYTGLTPNKYSTLARKN